MKLELLEGGLRVRLSEGQWRSLYDLVDISYVGRNVLAPLDLPVQNSEPPEVEEGLLAAARLAIGAGLIQIDMTTMAKDRGLIATLGTDGTAAAGAVRVLASPTEGAPTVPIPGVEVSAVHAKDLINELMRLMPPDIRTQAPEPTDAVTLPQEQALILAKAIRGDDAALAREVASQCGWDEVPEVLTALARDIRANATLGLRVAGSDSVGVRQWLQCELGWVSLAVRDGNITHTLCSPEQIKDDLIYLLAGAFEFALTTAASNG